MGGKVKVSMAEAPGDRSQSTPAPPSDRIKGSDKNKPGSAATRGADIDLSAPTEKALRNINRKFENEVKEIENSLKSEKNDLDDLGVMKWIIL